jgi:hypothetical protein
MTLQAITCASCGEALQGAPSGDGDRTCSFCGEIGLNYAVLLEGQLYAYGQLSISQENSQGKRLIRQFLLKTALIDKDGKHRAFPWMKRTEYGQGIKRPILEVVSGVLCGRDGRLVQKLRIIDRRSDHYRELVTDHETGEVIIEKDYPLSEKWKHDSERTPS